MTFKTVDLEVLSLQLNHLSKSLTDFESVLDQETETLKSTDISPLTDIVKQKHKLSELVSEQFNTLTSLLSDDHMSIKELMMLDSFSTLPKALQEQFETLDQQIITCNDKNTVNGLSVQALNSLNETLIQIFKGQDLENKTYNASGNASTPPTPTKPIGKA
ncbi:flagella synthesis protein FlgN [Hydrogenovibrio kuenenii]|jgi:flagellar biosynthesis protein FlgN|uniref:flagella synthesis protein FlgN n=1 Tax=Hydrogenovibrio kuenenii TaxID=63658 RepID=UPI000467BDF4|nr:flagellar protein FlgN [Hydrogenovibrio kuenenii]